MQEATDSKVVRLSVPAEPSYARPVRMLAANLAVLAGLSLEAVEDARMAAEEGFVWCCATKPQTCDVTFSGVEGTLAMEFSLGEAELPEDDQTSAYAELILTAVCDECVMDRKAGTLRLRKSTDVIDAQ
ncbi:ATP-binding protein [uncultured Parolsenella sp.]|uniref:ATP-binding protein n=1 Tax=uncultured Parolsenella sp. TaxID=2083008 RepID=UPI0025DF202C|nr:ATP-binding protein [uncultured Parolsenella sp.]